MKSVFTLLLLAYAICLFSCGSDKNSQSAIVAKWNLQQQHAVLYRDSVKITDTVYNASAQTYGTAQFNANGTFSSSCVYTPGGNTLASTGSSASSTGTYSYTSTSFSIVPGLAGWFVYVAGTSSISTSGASYSAQVTTLTNSNLTIHSTSTYTATNITGIHYYSETSDLYYTR
jgi:hypothetical protein